MNPWLISIPLAYLLGSIPFGYVLVKIFRKQDIRATGSGNIGATNVARSGAKGLGIATLILDLAKGYIKQSSSPSTSLLRTTTLAVAAAVAAILGHVFPVWLAFRGGKGVATAPRSLPGPQLAQRSLHSGRIRRRLPAHPLRLAGLYHRRRNLPYLRILLRAV